MNKLSTLRENDADDVISYFKISAKILFGLFFRFHLLVQGNNTFAQTKKTKDDNRN